MASQVPNSLKAAREVLGVGPFFGAGELRRAFRDAAKQAHPDRPGGSPERFRRRLRPITGCRPP
jgi:curved DNA-binding protein